MIKELLTDVGFSVGASVGLRVGTWVEEYDDEDVRDADKLGVQRALSGHIITDYSWFCNGSPGWILIDFFMTQ